MEKTFETLANHPFILLFFGFIFLVTISIISDTIVKIKNGNKDQQNLN